jgi:hypothetical protein
VKLSSFLMNNKYSPVNLGPSPEDELPIISPTPIHRAPSVEGDSYSDSWSVSSHSDSSSSRSDSSHPTSNTFSDSGSESDDSDIKAMQFSFPWSNSTFRTPFKSGCGCSFSASSSESGRCADDSDDDFYRPPSRPQSRRGTVESEYRPPSRLGSRRGTFDSEYRAPNALMSRRGSRASQHYCAQHGPQHGPARQMKKSKSSEVVKGGEGIVIKPKRRLSQFEAAGVLRPDPSIQRPSITSASRRQSRTFKSKLAVWKDSGFFASRTSIASRNENSNTQSSSSIALDNSVDSVAAKIVKWGIEVRSNEQDCDILPRGSITEEREEQE